jgi:hypothetical protein
MASSVLQDLRRQLREKFPQAHGLAVLPKASGEVAEKPFGVDSFPVGTISEIVPSSTDGGAISPWIAGLLAEPAGAAAFPRFVLVDGGDGFDPESHTAAACAALLWVRCRKLPEVIKAADLIVRDGNISFVMLDLCSLPAASLRTIPTSAWWRLKQLCETGACRLVVLCPVPLVPCASLRLELSVHLTLEDFERPRQEILQRLSARPSLLRYVR